MNDSSHRKIIHIDMDAFFASVEQRDNPDLRGKPVAVGGSSLRGVVAAASYEARAFGVHSAMPSVTARRKCPDLIFVKSRFDVYKGVSQDIHAIFAEYTPVIEPLSLDEAYLDLTGRLPDGTLATDVATAIRARILESTGLTASAGVSYNKFLAKIASGYRKPNGQTVIAPAKGEAFVEGLAIGKFHGVGPSTARRMAALGIHTGLDLKRCDLPFLQNHFGKFGLYLHNVARGIDDRPVRADRVRKSVGAERTFSTDLHAFAEATEALGPIADKVAGVCQGRALRGRTVTLKVKYNDFEQITRRLTLPRGIDDAASLMTQACRLLEPLFPTPKPIRLLGIGLSGFDGADPPAAPQMQFAI